MGIRRFTIAALLGISTFAYAQDPFLENNSQAASIADHGALNQDTVKPEAEKEAKPASFPGYGAFQNHFANYCKYLKLDGQNQIMQVVLDKLLKEKSDCSPCRQFFRSLSCKTTAKKQSNQSVKKSLEPSTELINVVSALFREISLKPAVAEPSVDNLGLIFKELENLEDLVAKKYFETLIVFIKDPLSEYFEKISEKEHQGKAGSGKRKLESLF